MKTFAGRRIDYSYDFWGEVNKALMTEACNFLMTARPGEPYYDYLMDWFRNAERSSGLHMAWKLGTPGVHAYEAMRSWRSDLRALVSLIPRLFPRGEETPRKVGDVLMHFRDSGHLQYGTELLWRMKRAYETICGRLYSSPMNDLVIPEDYFWLPQSQHPEQIEAREYTDECRKLQATRAGRKAKHLLLDNLTEAQARDYWYSGYFLVRPKEPDVPLEDRRLYAIERNFPNGNISSLILAKSRGGKYFYYPEYTFCFHAEEPYPIDDILLAQKLMIEQEHDDFLKLANQSQPPRNLQQPIHLSSRAI